MKIAVIDLETTGRDPSTGTIVEVGICLLDLETGFTSKLIDLVVHHPKFETLFETVPTHEDKSEDKAIENSWVFLNTSLTVEAVRNGVDWRKAGFQVQRIINKFPVTAYNRGFDLKFLCGNQRN